MSTRCDSAYPARKERRVTVLSGKQLNPATLLNAGDQPQEARRALAPAPTFPDGLDRTFLCAKRL